jgi:hypothetical protein
MGRIPVPMQPIPPDATPQERERIMRDYRAYLVRGARQSEQSMVVAVAILMFVLNGSCISFDGDQMTKVELDVSEVAAAGILSVGSKLRIFSLGSGVFIIVTNHELSQELLATFQGRLSEELTETLGAKRVLFIHSDDDNLGDFVPLQESKELKEMIQKIVRGELKMLRL